MLFADTCKHRALSSQSRKVFTWIPIAVGSAIGQFAIWLLASLRWCKIPDSVATIPSAKGCWHFELWMKQSRAPKALREITRNIRALRGLLRNNTLIQTRCSEVLSMRLISERKAQVCSYELCDE